MRKMTMAATLLLAACNSAVSDPEHDVSTCAAATDCEGGQACDLGTNECVSGLLTIEPTPEVVADATRWWTAVDDPLVKGTFEGPASAVIEVRVGEGAAFAATLEGTTWSVKLPANSIASTATQLEVRMSDPNGTRIALAQTFQLDDVAPHIALATSKLRDERGDTIDFSTGEPVHTHVGAEIDLAAGECPSVYKYAYLTGEDPAFGRQTTQNPLAWSFDIVEAKIETATYRVRDASNHVLRDWTEMLGANGAHRVEIDRASVAALGTYAGQLNIDVVVRDWTGREATSTSCIDYQPLAAPLQIEQVQPANATYAGIAALFSMSLTADSPVSQLAGSGLGAAIASQRIVQYTAEPITVSLGGAASGLRYARTYVDDYVATQTQSSPGIGCEQVDCWSPALADPTDSTHGGAVGTHSLTMALVDEATNQMLVTNTIPPRGANEAPRSYRLIAYLGQMVDLRPSASSIPDEHSLLGLTYTGLAPAAAITRCTSVAERCHQGVCAEVCVQTTTYQRIVALDRASIELDGLTFSVKTSPTSVLAGVAPGYVPATSFSLGPVTWNAGDDDLPGPQ